jgi:hypothetical protein
MMTTTALITLDAVLEATGATLTQIRLDRDGLKHPAVSVRMIIEGSTHAAIQDALGDVRRRGLLRGLVRAPRMVWVADRRIQTSPFLRIVLVFRRAAAAKHVAQSTKC